VFPLKIWDDLELHPLQAHNAEAMFNLVEHNRAHLDPWLRWSSSIQTLDDTRDLIERLAQKLAAGDGFHAGLWYQGQLTGGLVCHQINRESKKSEIGYWLGPQFRGKGIVTCASHAVIDYFFTHEKLHRIEIQCATDNRPSRAVAEKLGFTFEGIKRESEWITSGYRDHALYAMLDYEWPPAQ